MSEDFLSELHRTDPWIAAITPERVQKALEGFLLPFADGWNWRRLSTEIQNKVTAARGKPPQGIDDAITELTTLAAKAHALRQRMSRLGGTAEDAVFMETFRSLREAQKNENDHTDYDLLMLAPLETIANVLSLAASRMASQHRKQAPRWRDKYEQDQRVGFAIALTASFEAAFDTPARANNWRADWGEVHPWADFYSRIYCELFPEAARLNIAEVLQEAARELPKLESWERWLQDQDATRIEDSGE